MVSISGSPGLEDEKLRKTRASKDALLAQTMKELTLETFLDLWYEQPLWERYWDALSCPCFSLMSHLALKPNRSVRTALLNKYCCLL